MGHSAPLVVSRLRWTDHHAADAIELPNVRGIPVDRAAPPTSIVVREWPNRLGICETARPGDVVRWYPDLADPPVHHDAETIDLIPLDLTGRPRDPSLTADLALRTAWLRDIVGAAGQRPGFAVAHPVVAPCAIVLTPGAAPRPAVSEPGAVPSGTAPFGTKPSGAWGPTLSAVPRRLAEYPGGVQLVVTASVWARRDAYAVAVERTLDARRIPGGEA